MLNLPDSSQLSLVTKELDLHRMKMGLGNNIIKVFSTENNT